jgi:hypothetical protein
MRDSTDSLQEVSQILQHFDELDRNAFPIPNITQLPFLGDFEFRRPNHDSFEDRLSAARSHSQTIVQPNEASLSQRPSISPEALPEEGEVELYNPEANYTDPQYRPGFVEYVVSPSTSIDD